MMMGRVIEILSKECQMYGHVIIFGHLGSAGKQAENFCKFAYF
jgi:hypothetical protein